jgi:hypothetical protein
MVRLSALSIGRLYAPGNIPGIHFCQRLSRPQSHNAAGRIMSMRNSNDTIGNRTHGFQPTGICICCETLSRIGDFNSVVNSSDDGMLHLELLVCGAYLSTGIQKRIQRFENCTYCRVQVGGCRGTCWVGSDRKSRCEPLGPRPPEDKKSSISWKAVFFQPAVGATDLKHGVEIGVLPSFSQLGESLPLPSSVRKVPEWLR